MGKRWQGEDELYSKHMKDINIKGGYIRFSPKNELFIRNSLIFPLNKPHIVWDIYHEESHDRTTLLIKAAPLWTRIMYAVCPFLYH